MTHKLKLMMTAVRALHPSGYPEERIRHQAEILIKQIETALM